MRKERYSSNKFFLSIKREKQMQTHIYIYVGYTCEIYVCCYLYALNIYSYLNTHTCKEIDKVREKTIQIKNLINLKVHFSGAYYHYRKVYK
jgi:hypothetical protein